MRYSSTFTQQHSPLMIGSAGLFVYVGLGFLSYIGLDVPGGIWLSGLVIFVVGLVLEILTRRYAYVKIYQVVVFSYMASAFGVLLWVIVSGGRSLEIKLLVAAIIAVSLAATPFFVYRNNFNRRSDLSLNPIGPFGSLNWRTGMVSPDTSPKHHRKEMQTETGYTLLRRVGPLIAGLSMAIAGSLQGTAVDFVIALVAFAIAYGAAAGAGGMWFYLVAARRWEKEHGKRIYVQR